MTILSWGIRSLKKLCKFFLFAKTKLLAPGLILDERSTEVLIGKHDGGWLLL
jgi:hypothetical protein